MRKIRHEALPKLKDIARQTFDREILIHGADKSFRRFENDPIIGVVGNRAAGSQSNESRPAPAAQAMIHGIVMNQRCAPATLGAKTFGKHFHDAVEFFAREISIRPGGTGKVEELSFIPIFS